jgi:hypothetical protein
VNESLLKRAAYNTAPRKLSINSRLNSRLHSRVVYSRGEALEINTVRTQVPATECGLRGPAARELSTRALRPHEFANMNFL